MIEPPEIILIAFVSIILFLIIFFSFKPKEKYPYFSRDTLLTPAELRFFQVLKKVIPPSQSISCKVRLADIINCSNINWQKGYGPRISSKHIDFVLFSTETSNILLCIELDDSSHSLPDRKKRDVFVDKSLHTADVPILRVKVSRGYDMAFLQKEIKIALR